MRRPRVSWMTNADDHILQFLLNEDNREIVATPAVIAENIDFNAGYVRQRVSTLLEEGLIEYQDEDRGMYQITERGRKYLRGELGRTSWKVDFYFGYGNSGLVQTTIPI